MALSPSQLQTINDLVTATTVFSFFGSLFIILSLLYWTYADVLARRLQDIGIQRWTGNFKTNPKVNLNLIAYRLVFNVAISDMLYEVSYWFTTPSTPSHSHSCRFSGWLQQFGTLSSVMWITLITHLIHKVVMNPSKDSRQIEQNMLYYHLGVWGTSFTTSFLPLLSGSYGQSGGWCWIKDSGWGLAWRFLIFYFPIWAIIVYIVYIYYESWKSLGLNADIIKRMRLYPIILVASWTFGTINRIVQASGKDSYGLVCVAAFFMSLYGFCNAMAYVLTPQVWESLASCGSSSSLQDRMSHADTKNNTTDVELRQSGAVKESSEDIGVGNTESYIDAQVDIGIRNTTEDFSSQERMYTSDMNSMDVVYAKESSGEFQHKAPAQGRDAAIEVQSDYPLSEKKSEPI